MQKLENLIIINNSSFKLNSVVFLFIILCFRENLLKSQKEKVTSIFIFIEIYILIQDI